MARGKGAMSSAADPNRPMHIAVEGFGHIGTCLGAVLASRGHEVIGIDAGADVVAEMSPGTTKSRAWTSRLRSAGRG